MEKPTSSAETGVGRATPVLGTQVAQTKAGWIGLAFSQRGLAALRFPMTTRAEALADLARAFPGAELLPNNAWADVKADLVAYFAGTTVHFRVTCDLEGGTPFQRLVWGATMTIPYSETRSYAWVAAEIGASQAFRAVGMALKANPIPIIIPCHRVLRSDGSLGGYAGGRSLKQRLLALEKGVPFVAVRELIE